MVPGWVQCQINLDLGDISMNWYNLCHTQTDIVYIHILTNMFKLSPNWSCVSLDGPSNWLPEKMQSHFGCICLTFLHCVSSNVSSKCLLERMHNHNDCICLAFLRCVPSNHSLCHSENLLYWHSSQWTQNIEGFYLPYFFGGERLYSPYLCTFVWVVTFYDKKYDSAGKKKWKCFVTLNHLSVSKKKRKWTIKPVETKKTLSKKEKSGKKTEQGTPANLQLAQRQHWGGRSIHWLSRGGERRFIFFWWGFWWRGFWRWVQTLPLVPKSSFFSFNCNASHCCFILLK